MSARFARWRAPASHPLSMAFFISSIGFGFGRKSFDAKMRLKTKLDVSSNTRLTVLDYTCSTCAIQIKNQNEIL